MTYPVLLFFEGADPIFDWRLVDEEAEAEVVEELSEVEVVAGARRFRGGITRESGMAFSDYKVGDGGRERRVEED